jgi:hypothetical protein
VPSIYKQNISLAGSTIAAKYVWVQAIHIMTSMAEGNHCSSSVKWWNEKINEIKKILGSLPSPALPGQPLKKDIHGSGRVKCHT